VFVKKSIWHYGEQEANTRCFLSISIPSKKPISRWSKTCSMDPANDLSLPHPDCNTLESIIDILGDISPFGEIQANNGRLCPCVDEGLEPVVVDLHGNVEHRGGNERLGQVLLRVLSHVSSKNIQVVVQSLPVYLRLYVLLVLQKLRS
jgi:hypothetical protein